MTLWWVAFAGFTALAVLLEEGWTWYLMTGHSFQQGREGSRRARQGRQLSNVSLAAAAGCLAAAVSGTGYPPFSWAFALGVVAAGGAGLAGFSWRSPITILGRTVTGPLLPVGSGILRTLDWVTGRGDDEEEDWVLESWESGAGEGQAERVIATLREFRTSVVEDVMVPREEVQGLQADWTVDRAMEIIRELGFSRYPVYTDSLDTVTGVLHVFDLVGARPDAPLADYLRPPFMTTETKPITSLLRELQRSYNQMAVVVDEMGGTAGVVTVEDLLEELVGEIEDESDAPESPIKALEANVFWVDGSLRIDELNERLDLDLPEGEYDTVAGLILERLERIPKIGERVRVAGVSFEVAAAEPNRVSGLRLIIGS